MREIISKRLIILILVLIAAIALPLFLKNKFYMNIVIMVIFYAALSGSWNILAGYAGQLSLGHTIFFGLGAYTSTLLLVKMGVSPWIGLFAALIVSMGIGALIGWPAFRLKGPFFTLATLAFSEVIRYVASYWKEFTNGAMGINIPFKPGLATMMFRSKEPYYYIALGMLLIIILITYMIDRSKIGSYFTAIRENEDAAEALGIPITRYKMYAILISSGLAAMTGVFYAQYILFIEPESVFNINFSSQIALMSIIGGMGTIFGPIVGAVLLVPLNEIVRATFTGLNGLNYFIYGIVLIVVVSWMPNGILPTITDWFKRRRSKVNKDREGAVKIDSAN